MSDAYRIYVASTLSNAAMWRMMRDKELFGSNIIITASWIDNPDILKEQSLAEGIFSKAWDSNIEEVRGSDLLVVYWKSGDQNLRGALVEVGVALGVGLPVIACGLHVDSKFGAIWGSWRFHPNITRIPKIEDLPAGILKIRNH